MKKNLNIQLTAVFTLILILVSALLYLIFSPPAIKKSSGEVQADYIALLKDPQILAVFIGLVFTYLIIDRWKNIESRMDKLRDDQNISIKGIEETAKNRIKDKVENVISKAETIDRKVTGLIESHPWIGLITENEIIPDIPTCKVVLDTCNKLLLMDDGKRALTQEYIYFWVGKRISYESGGSPKSYQLEGTTDDFFKLINFCEEQLEDEYLAFLVLRSGYNFTATLTPYYLRKLINYGDIHEAKKVVTYLKRIIKVTLISKVVAIFYDRFYNNADYQARGLALIGLFESLKGRDRRSRQYLEKAQEISQNTNTSDFVKCVNAEVLLHAGKLQASMEILCTIEEKNTSNEVRKYYREIARKLTSEKPSILVAQKNHFYEYLTPNPVTPSPQKEYSEAKVESKESTSETTSNLNKIKLTSAASKLDNDPLSKT